jgi:hypothetical protein
VDARPALFLCSATDAVRVGLHDGPHLWCSRDRFDFLAASSDGFIEAFRITQVIKARSEFRQGSRRSWTILCA